MDDQGIGILMLVIVHQFDVRATIDASFGYESPGKRAHQADCFCSRQATALAMLLSASKQNHRYQPTHVIYAFSSC